MLSADLEIRLAALEAEVAMLKRLLPTVSETPWWEKIVGTFADDPVYEEAMQFGQQYRQSLKPLAEEASESKHKFTVPPAKF
ncbi:MAG: hypothetical protein GPJ03_21605 [Microcystis aeruginosa G13-01]|jgi:hypothetical protein|nr:hypothetical protein [Microcystis aeruginosa LE13-04]NCR45854.1 hypothetical protein [Microcystis aeruginosa SX13-01]NCT45561.1 hypothetical protein [Microcystis aeruginosa G11-09]NCT65385.1 hypothetical protein [Microcystis aeruginosa G13-01]